MREKELRLALICYGGISLAVYMHGITKEIWRLAKASQSYHSRKGPAEKPSRSEDVYITLFEAISRETGVELRVLVDILAGASAGGINAIFLAEAISNGLSLEPLTDLWLETADVDKLIDQDVGRLTRFAKNAAVPIAWALSSRGRVVEASVEDEHRDEVRSKLANFVRSRWFAPPFSGPGFTNLVLDALEAMHAKEAGARLLPDYQPLDLFVSVTDYHGHPRRLRLHSPEEVTELEHRLTISFRDSGGPEARLADVAELAFAARATASFPGAFPPFKVTELDAVLAGRKHDWPGREEFLKRALPGYSAIGQAENALLIDGSVLANAPFRPAIDALQSRPARREVDRRFVYIDPSPGGPRIRLSGTTEAEPPGFFATLLAALSDIPREQPIRDSLEAIQTRSDRIERMRAITEAMRTDVEAAIGRSFGSLLFLSRPNPKRLAAWRARASVTAARDAGYAYAAYANLRLASVIDDIARAIYRLSGGGSERRERVRTAIKNYILQARAVTPEASGGTGIGHEAAYFLDICDFAYRTRRLQFVLRHLAQIEESGEVDRDIIQDARNWLYDLLGKYRSPIEGDRSEAPQEFRNAEDSPDAALRALSNIMNLAARDLETDHVVTKILAGLPKKIARSVLFSYLGFPFYDIATLPLLQGEGLEEFDPVKVDRISPDDAKAIREGGAAATLKGTQFSNFGAFFSRAYRENDYLWGRLHGADRLIDIVVSALPENMHLPPGTVAGLKRDAFRLILMEEQPRLTSIADLIAELEKEIC